MKLIFSSSNKYVTGLLQEGEINEEAKKHRDVEEYTKLYPSIGLPITIILV